MKLIVLTDIHDGGAKRGFADIFFDGASRLLLRRAIRRINRFLKPDLVVVLGDLVEDGTAADADERYTALLELLNHLEAPWFALPGNHDDPDRMYQQFPRPPDHLDVAGVRVVPFEDEPAADHLAHRSEADLARARAASRDWRGPIVAVHHVPLFAPGTTDCPYNYTNAEEAIAANQAGGIVLTVGGHYHAGTPLVPTPSGWALAAPALAAPPFRFCEIAIEPNEPPRVAVHALRMPEELALEESHVHTEFAYCAADISMAGVVDVCRLVGVAAPAFAEHSGQLYFDRDSFWSASFMREGIGAASSAVCRVSSYLQQAAAWVPRSRVGFETDFDFEGHPVLTAEHRRQTGFLIGAWHWTPETARGLPFDSALCAERHRRIWDRMLSSGIDVLAHPFRIWNRAGVRPPEDLMIECAKRLAQFGVAAELNFHQEEPDPVFVRACLEYGVRLSLGTDSHSVVQVGEFWPHLRWLERIGVGSRDLDRYLWRPGMKSACCAV